MLIVQRENAHVSDLEGRLVGGKVLRHDGWQRLVWQTNRDDDTANGEDGQKVGERNSRSHVGGVNLNEQALACLPNEGMFSTYDNVQVRHFALESFLCTTSLNELGCAHLHGIICEGLSAPSKLVVG